MPTENIAGSQVCPGRQCQNGLAGIPGFSGGGASGSNGGGGRCSFRRKYGEIDDECEDLAALVFFGPVARIKAAAFCRDTENYGIPASARQVSHQS